MTHYREEATAQQSAEQIPWGNDRNSPWPALGVRIFQNDNNAWKNPDYIAQFVALGTSPIFRPANNGS